MKSNLHSHYKTDSELEKEGVWIVFPSEAKFRVKRFGGANSAKVMAVTAAISKPYARLIQLGTLPEEKDMEITITVFVKSCLTDWSGVEIDGKLIPFSEEAAIDLLIELPELFKELLAHAQKKDDYKEDLGNS